MDKVFYSKFCSSSCCDVSGVPARDGWGPRRGIRMCCNTFITVSTDFIVTRGNKRQKPDTGNHSPLLSSEVGTENKSEELDEPLSWTLKEERQNKSINFAKFDLVQMVHINQNGKWRFLTVWQIMLELFCEWRVASVVRRECELGCGQFKFFKSCNIVINYTCSKANKTDNLMYKFTFTKRRRIYLSVDIKRSWFWNLFSAK